MAEQGLFTIDVGGTAIKYGYVEMKNGEPALAENGSVPISCSTAEEFFALLNTLYENHGHAAPGIGLSVPGIVDTDREVNISCGAMERYLEPNCPTAALLSERCKVPVHLINDAKAAALAEAGYGVLKGVKYGAVVIIGNGVGGAFVLDGNVMNGAHFAAGEFSRVFADIHAGGEGGLWCETGNCHALCRRAAGGSGPETDQKSENRQKVAVAEKQSNTDIAAAGQRNEESGNTEIKEEIQELSGIEVFRRIEAGDPIASDALEIYAWDMAAMLQSVQMFYDPEKIAIGGGISRQPLLIEAIRRHIDAVYEEASGDGFPKPVIEACRYLSSANLIGAYVNFFHKQAAFIKNL